jgi:hypothetical protein
VRDESADAHRAVGLGWPGASAAADTGPDVVDHAGLGWPQEPATSESATGVTGVLAQAMMHPTEVP